jgi:hypothetical protein
MIPRPPRKGFAEGGLSFLDCICCGFGAVVLLFVLSQGGHPVSVEKARQNLHAQAAATEEQAANLEKERQALGVSVDATSRQASQQEKENRKLEEALTARRSALTEKGGAANPDQLDRELQAARQELSEVQRRLEQPAATSRMLAGIPVDSEHVVFLVDTSGSMFNYQWDLVCAKVDETLDAYPNLKGIQMMSEVGLYMFPDTAGRWMADSPATRERIKSVLKVWGAFPEFRNPPMASNPVPGIERAMKDLHQPGLSMCLYIFGDELMDSAIGTREAIKRVDAAVGGLTGPARCPVHCLGFPLVVTGEHLRVSGKTNRQWPRANGENFATFMREVCRMTGGTFVGLSHYK